MDVSKLVMPVLGWLKDQPFPNVIALLNLALLGLVAFCALFYIVPSERVAIFENQKSVIEEHSKQIDRVCTSFEKALDRYSGNRTARTSSQE